jgi:hypothetical protein
MAKRRPPLVATTALQDGKERHHFFAASMATWRTMIDLGELIQFMKKEGYAFNVWLVPGPEAQDYKIAYFAPQVEGAIWLAFYGTPPKPGSP